MKITECYSFEYDNLLFLDKKLDIIEDIFKKNNIIIDRFQVHFYDIYTYKGKLCEDKRIILNEINKCKFDIIKEKGYYILQDIGGKINECNNKKYKKFTHETRFKSMCGKHTDINVYIIIGGYYNDEKKFREAIQEIDTKIYKQSIILKIQKYKMIFAIGGKKYFCNKKSDIYKGGYEKGDYKSIRKDIKKLNIFSDKDIKNVINKFKSSKENITTIVSKTYDT